MFEIIKAHGTQGNNEAVTQGQPHHLIAAGEAARWMGDTAYRIMHEERNGDFRLLHDGTQGVAVNPRTMGVDQHECPWGRRQSGCVGMDSSDGAIAWGFKGGWARRAPHTFKVSGEVHGSQCCKLKDTVIVNREGTQGIGSAVTIFARLFAIFCRLVYYVLAGEDS